MNDSRNCDPFCNKDLKSKSNGMAWIYVGILYQYFTDDHYFVRYKTKNRRGIENG